MVLTVSHVHFYLQKVQQVIKTPSYLCFLLIERPNVASSYHTMVKNSTRVARARTAWPFFSANDLAKQKQYLSKIAFGLQNM